MLQVRLEETQKHTHVNKAAGCGARMKTSEVKQCLSILLKALLIAMTPTQREKRRVKTGIRKMPEKVGTHASQD